MKNIYLLLISVLVLVGCGQTVVLLPDLDGHVGQVVVTPRKGDPVVLSKANEAVGADLKAYTMDEGELQRVFCGALEAQPQPTAKFILYFDHDSTRLKDPSKLLLPEIIQTYFDRRSTDVSVIGHSDGMGDKKYNYDLSMRRAQKISSVLIDAGIPVNQIQTISHGEENPMIPNVKGRSEPRNRRVEVLIR